MLFRYRKDRPFILTIGVRVSSLESHIKAKEKEQPQEELRVTGERVSS